MKEKKKDMKEADEFNNRVESFCMTFGALAEDMGLNDGEVYYSLRLLTLLSEVANEEVKNKYEKYMRKMVEAKVKGIISKKMLNDLKKNVKKTEEKKAISYCG